MKEKREGESEEDQPIAPTVPLTGGNPSRRGVEVDATETAVVPDAWLARVEDRSLLLPSVSLCESESL